MAKTKTSGKKSTSVNYDGVYLLKVVLYMILGMQWVWLVTPGSSFPIPVGLLIGMVFTSHEHFQVDRKIEYAVLLVATLVGFVARIGIAVNLS